MPARLRCSIRPQLVLLAAILLALFTCGASARAQSGYVRVSQVGYEAGETPFRAYLMSTTTASGESFEVLNSKGNTVYIGHVGSLLGAWSHSKKITYEVYALDFTVPAGDLYKISVSNPAATSPRFAVDRPDKLYSGLLLNTLFFYYHGMRGGERGRHGQPVEQQ